MRTRFLNVDYFREASRGDLEPCNVFIAPVPELHNPFNLSTELECSNFDHLFTVPSELQSLFFENALSNFVSSVFPEVLSVGNGEFPTVSGARKGEFPASSVPVSQKENNDGKGMRFSSRNPKDEISENDSFSNGRDDRSCRIVLFETPEVEILMKEHTCPFLEENDEIYQEIQLEMLETKLSLDMLNFKLGDVFLNHYEIASSDNSAEDMTATNHTNQSSYRVEDANSGQDLTILNSSKILSFEIREFFLHESAYMEEAFLVLVTSSDHSYWPQNHDLVIDFIEFQGDVDILDLLLGHGPNTECLEVHHTCLYSLLEMDHRSQNNPVIDLKSAEDNFVTLIHPVHFHEFQVLDLAFIQTFEVFYTSIIASDPKISELMFTEDLKSFKSFHESVVGPELALVDDTFKSFPIPIMCDDKELPLPSAVVEDILSDLKPHLASACDGIYLDWHPLQEDTCNSAICSTCRKKLEEVDTYMTSQLQSPKEGSVLSDLVFFDDPPRGSNALQCKETLCELPGVTLVATKFRSKTPSSMLLKQDEQITQNGEPNVKMNSEKASSLLESMSVFNDFRFFINVRKGNNVTNCEDFTKTKTSNEATVPVSFIDLTSTCDSPEVNSQQWNIEVHWIKLSDHILVLIDNIRKNYLDVLDNDTDLKEKHPSFPVVDDYELLSFPKQKLMDLITDLSSRETTLTGKDEILMAFIALYSMKQMACYLCFYGIHTTHMYVSILFRSLDFLGVRLAVLQSLIEDAHCKAEKDIIESHPSLATVEEILKSHSSQSGKKVLIVAERVFLWLLKRKLASMGILFHELAATQTFSNHQSTLEANDEFINSILGALLHSDCLITSHENVYGSFPFNKFTIILEYGGSYRSSKMSAIYPKLDVLPHVHFLKVKLEDFMVPNALCEGFDVSQHLQLTMEEATQLIHTVQEGFKGEQCVQLLKFLPVLKNDTLAATLRTPSEVEDCFVPEFHYKVSPQRNSEDFRSSISTFPDVVIIVNTQNFGKELLTSRRSSYQKILALENGGVQVVEREYYLPVDIIFSASICLVWYDAGKIGFNVKGREETSCISTCVENIATNLLMSLSFAFSDCILVFEGETNFLAAIMESSDGLYAAAASLDLQLQLFFSVSSELTDEIILCCIRYATELNKGLYPTMRESETLGESFLTSFPSVNPLSAHAVLSCGGVLREFLGWSNGQRLQALEKYHVPEESVVLFSALSRYGELGESISGMTECSSSLSSAPDSDNCYSKVQPQENKKKHTTSTCSLDIPMDDCLHAEPLNRYKEGCPKPFGVSLSYQSRVLSNIHEGHKRIESSNLSKKHVGQNQGLDTFPIKELDWNNDNRSENMHNDFRGEVIDLNDSLFTGNFSSIANQRNFSKEMLELGKEAAAGSLVGGRIFATNPSTSSLNSADCDCDSDIWTSLMGSNHLFEEEIFRQPKADADMDALPIHHQGQCLPGINMRQVSSTNTLGISKRTPHYRGIPHPKDTSSSQQGSPCTIEFLNRIKEKAKMNQLSTQCNMSLTCSGNSRNTHVGKSFKRKSPSIIEGYQYKGGSRFLKAKVEQKPMKRFKLPSDSSHKEKKVSSYLTPTWTPIEMRSRKVLSFMTRGKEKQSKLVWSDGDVHDPRKKHRKEA